MGGEFGTIRHAGLARHLDTRAGQVVPLPRLQGGLWTVDSGQRQCASRPLCCCIPASNRPSPVSLKLEGPLPWQPWRTLQAAGPFWPHPLDPCKPCPVELGRDQDQRVMPPPRCPESKRMTSPLCCSRTITYRHLTQKLDVTTVSGGSLQRVAAIITARCPARPPTDTETTGWGSSGWWASSR